MRSFSPDCFSQYPKTVSGKGIWVVRLGSVGNVGSVGSLESVGRVESVGRHPKVGRIIVAVSFCASLPAVLTF